MSDVNRAAIRDGSRNRMTDMPPLALLAGGLATRLGDLTKKVPKAMLDVAGEPFIAHQLRLMRREHVPRVVICTGYLAEQIEAYVGDGSRFGIPVSYRIDGPKLLGTGGALRAALPELGDAFLVMYGDSWLDTSYAPIVEAFSESGQPALMTVFPNAGQWDTSNVWFENGRIRLYDKRERLPQMQHIDWGLGSDPCRSARGVGPRTSRSISRRSIPICRARESLPDTRSRRASTRSARPPGLKETDALLRVAACADSSGQGIGVLTPSTTRSYRERGSSPSRQR